MPRAPEGSRPTEPQRGLSIEEQARILHLGERIEALNALIRREKDPEKKKMYEDRRTKLKEQYEMAVNPSIVAKSEGKGPHEGIDPEKWNFPLKGNELYFPHELDRFEEKSSYHMVVGISRADIALIMAAGGNGKLFVAGASGEVTVENLSNPASNESTVLRIDGKPTALAVGAGSLFTGTSNGSIWESTPGQQQDWKAKKIWDSIMEVRSIQALPDGRLVVAAGEFFFVLMINQASGRCELEAEVGLGSPVVNAQMLPDGRIVAGSVNGLVSIYRKEKDKVWLRRTIANEKDGLSQFQATSDSRVVTLSGRRVINSWRDGNYSNVSDEGVTAFQALPDNRYVVGYKNGLIDLYGEKGAVSVGTHWQKGRGASIAALLALPSGEIISSGAENNGHINIWG